MSVFEINYSKTETLASQASKVSKELKSYSQEIGELELKLSDGAVTELDNWGYVSAALSEAKKKASIADEKAGVYSRFSAALTSLCTTAKQSDSLAAANIERIFDARIGERTIFQKIGDFLYETYINFLDKVSSFGAVGKNIADFIKNGTDWLENAFERAKNWFKYGLGKYVYNIIMAGVDVCVAIGVIVAAMGALVVTGPAWLAAIGIVGIIASCAFMLMQTKDSCVAVEENVKALKLTNDGNITAARYYGEIKGVKDKTTHYDYGDSTDNAVMEALGEEWDSAKTVMKTTATVCTFVSGFGKLGLTQNANSETVFDFDRAVEEYKYKMLHDAGFNSNDTQNGGFSMGTGFNPIKKVFSNKYEKILNGIGCGGSGKGLDAAKSWSKIDKMVKAHGKLKKGGLSTYETIDKGLDILGNLPFVDSFTGDIWKFVSSTKSTIQAAAV